MEPRNVCKVIDQILEVIPETEGKLIFELKDYYSSLWNKAPEILTAPECWKPVGGILASNIANLNEPWKIRVHKIFTNRE
jgi:hypothetical protein